MSNIVKVEYYKQHRIEVYIDHDIHLWIHRQEMNDYDEDSIYYEYQILDVNGDSVDSLCGMQDDIVYVIATAKEEIDNLLKQ